MSGMKSGREGRVGYWKIVGVLGSEALGQIPVWEVLKVGTAWEVGIQWEYLGHKEKQAHGHSRAPPPICMSLPPFFVSSCRRGAEGQIL